MIRPLKLSKFLDMLLEFFGLFSRCGRVRGRRRRRGGGRGSEFALNCMYYDYIWREQPNFLIDNIFFFFERGGEGGDVKLQIKKKKISIWSRIWAEKGEVYTKQPTFFFFFLIFKKERCNCL